MKVLTLARLKKMRPCPDWSSFNFSRCLAVSGGRSRVPIKELPQLIEGDDLCWVLARCVYKRSNLIKVATEFFKRYLKVVKSQLVKAENDYFVLTTQLANARSLIEKAESELDLETGKFKSNVNFDTLAYVLSPTNQVLPAFLEFKFLMMSKCALALHCVGLEESYFALQVVINHEHHSLYPDFFERDYPQIIIHFLETGEL